MAYAWALAEICNETYVLNYPFSQENSEPKKNTTC